MKRNREHTPGYVSMYDSDVNGEHVSDLNSEHVSYANSEDVSYVNSAHVSYVDSEHVSYVSSERASYVNSEHVSYVDREHVSETPAIIVLGISRVHVGRFGPIFGQIESHRFQEAFANPPAPPGAHI